MKMAATAGAVTLLLSIRATATPADRTRCVADSDRGQDERDRGAFLEARASFRACATDECPAIVRKDCGDWLAAVEASLPSVVVGARDAHGNDLTSVRVVVDGRPRGDEAASGRAIELDPGPHLFRFEHAPDPPVEMKVVLRTGEHNRSIVAAFPAPGGSPGGAPPPPPSTEARPITVTRVSTWAYVLGAVAIAGGGAFTYFGATGLSEKSDLRATCGNTCTDAQVAPLKTKYILADTSLGLGIVAAAAATWLFLHPSREPAPSAAIGASIAPMPGGVAAGLAARF